MSCSFILNKLFILFSRYIVRQIRRQERDEAESAMDDRIRGQTKTAYQNTPRRDRELIRRIQAGNKELLGELIGYYYDEILRFCIWQIRDTGDTYDLTQETFYRFIRSVDTYEYRNLRAYLYAIARNLCVDYQREEKPVPVSGEQEELDPAHGGTESGYAQAEESLFLAGLLDALPAEQREIILLKYYGCLKLAEIARILDVNLSTVKSRLRLGLKRMRAVCGEEEDRRGQKAGQKKGETA